MSTAQQLSKYMEACRRWVRAVKQNDPLGAMTKPRVVDYPELIRPGVREVAEKHGEKILAAAGQ